MKLSKLDHILKNDLLEKARIKDKDRILDFGCGTGTLTIMAKKENPNATVHGVDVDPKIFKIAKNKIKHENLEIRLNIYKGISLPYKDKMFDKVLSSLVFHHLLREEKINALEEIYRILKYGGTLYIYIFNRPTPSVIHRGR